MITISWFFVDRNTRFRPFVLPVDPNATVFLRPAAVPVYNRIVYERPFYLLSDKSFLKPAFRNPIPENPVPCQARIHRMMDNAYRCSRLFLGIVPFQPPKLISNNEKK
jgi:hypothetical protein